MRWVTPRGVALEEVSGVQVRLVPLSVILETFKDGCYEQPVCSQEADI